MASIKAIVKPELLVWTRQRAKVTIEDAAKAVHVSIERLQAWETEGEEDAPTVAQLRTLAAKYQFPLAVFYLPGPPSDFAPLRDFRQLTDVEDEAIGPNLAFHIRAAYEHRELALEIFEDLRSQPNSFPLNVTLNDSPEKVGQAIRDMLGVDDENQKRSAARAFDFWRRRIEEKDILVFVISGPHRSVELSQMRGFAIARPELPVIVINGRDYSQGGKAFTLLHELTHIALGESAISNGAIKELSAAAEEQRIERFCDAVAAAALMPEQLITSMVQAFSTGVREWTDQELHGIASSIGVSREALLIRFVNLKRATWGFYKEQRDRFLEEYRRAAEKKAKDKTPTPIKRSVMLMSWNGRGFTRLVLRSYYDQRITLNDVSSYLGAKVKHIPALERAAFQMTE
jgi:Zn-dependent peptidase ImmA (M78 family)/DNA-binding XRE family transcriptional regulator